MSVMPLLLTLLPIAVILCMLIVMRKAADISGIVGWLAISVVAYFAFHTSIEVIVRSTAAGFVRSFSVSLIVATSLLQMAFMEKTGALKRIIIFIKTIGGEHSAVQIMMINIGFGTLMVAVGATPVSILPPILVAMGYSTYVAIALPAIGYDSLCTYALLGALRSSCSSTLRTASSKRLWAKGHEISLHQAGMVFFMFLPVVSTLIGFCMLWIVGKWQGRPRGLATLPHHRRRHRRRVLLHEPATTTSWFSRASCAGLAVIVVMAFYLKAVQKKPHHRQAAA